METRQSNVKVWEDTFSLVETGIFKNIKISPSIKLSFNDLAKIKDTQNESECTLDAHTNPILEIINEDTFTCAQRVRRLGYNPLVLNMACDTTPGGGVRKGAQAQEENLFRRSNYYKFLPSELYPILDDEVIYSPNVSVFKDKDYKLLTNKFAIACIACAAIRSPRVQWIIITDDTNIDMKQRIFYHNEDYLLTKDKIRSIFKVAYFYGHDSLILGALGCGAFHNPPEAVAQIFNEVLAEYKYCFKYFCFAIYSINDPNYDIFMKYIHF